MKVVRSHIVKHGASDNVAASGAPQPASMQMEKHKNKTAFRIYQAKEALEMAEFRQLLNAPPGLRRTDRSFSQLDVFLAVKKELSRANFHHAKQVLWASGGVGVPTTLMCTHHADVYTHRSDVYTHHSDVYTGLSLPPWESALTVGCAALLQLRRSHLRCCGRSRARRKDV